MGYSNHRFEFSDLECLTLINGLNLYIKNKKIHPDNKKIAGEIKDIILETVKKDKEINND